MIRMFLLCDVEGKLNEWIRLFTDTLKGRQTLFIIDDCLLLAVNIETILYGS